MHILDLTHPLAPDMPVFPGTDPPEFETGCTLAEHGFLERRITMFSHIGTHIDAPAHMVEGGWTLDMFPVDQFFGRGCLYRHESPESGISVDHLRSLVDALQDADYLLIATGWDRYWGRPEYFASFPVLEPATAQWLMQFQLKGVGLDVISADAIDSSSYAVHHILFAHNCLIVENLKGLSALPADSCHFQCLPLALPAADGSPVRAVAIID